MKRVSTEKCPVESRMPCILQHSIHHDCRWCVECALDRLTPEERRHTQNCRWYPEPNNRYLPLMARPVYPRWVCAAECPNRYSGETCQQRNYCDRCRMLAEARCAEG